MKVQNKKFKKKTSEFNIETATVVRLLRGKEVQQ